MNESTKAMICETAPGERGHWMGTYSDGKFYPLDPRPEDIDIIDIAHHLAMQCRFNGATKAYYSVAEHCIIGSYMVPEEHAFEFLMHDASEAWIGDLIRPMKHHSLLGDEFRRIEAPIDLMVRRAFGLPDQMSPVVKKIDDAMCVVELANAFEHPRRTLDDLRSLDIPRIPFLHFWEWRDAKEIFLSRFFELAPLEVRR